MSLEVWLVTCPCCDGAGEWDEGPLPASSGATEPEYRQVICPQCEGTGKAEIADCAPEDLDQETRVLERRARKYLEATTKE